MADDPDDIPRSDPPLPPEDRLWRHPSEMARTAAPPLPTGHAARRRGRRRALVAVAVLSGLTGAAASVVVLATAGSLSTRSVTRIERRTMAVSPSTTTPRNVRTVAASAAPAIVEVAAAAGEQRRRGSGVVLRADGLILTSAQLVATADRVVVTWASGRTAEASVEGHDDMTGLAALRVEGDDLPTPTVEAQLPRPGDVAVTVAASSGTSGPTLTQGLVSATGAHADPDGGRLLGLIETDRPVPGWADGGALVDGDGRLRGVSLAVAGAAATGWAVPIAVAEQVAGDLDERGRVNRGWLGISGVPSDPDGDVPAGVSIAEVASDSPAAAAGLAPGDVVVAVAGQGVRSLADVQAAMIRFRPGQAVGVAVVNDGDTTIVEITLARAPG